MAAIVVSLLLFRAYLFAGEPLYGDANFLWSRSLLHAELWQMLNIWRNSSGGVSGAVMNASQSFILLQAILSPFGVPLSTVLVWPVLIASAFLAFRRFAYTLGATGWAAILAAAFYAGNPWLWDQLLAGHVAICAATALAPVVLSTAVRLYRGDAGAGWLLPALSALQLLADPRIALFVYAMLFIGGIVGMLRLRTEWRNRALRFAVFSLTAPFAGVVANAWWTGMYAFTKSGNPVPSFYPPVEGIVTYSAFADFPHALALSGYFIHFDWQRMQQFGMPTFVLWYAAMLFLLLVPALLAKPRVARWAATAGVVVGVFMSMGSHAMPLAILYWMYSHIPLLSLLREPVKYDFVVALGIAILIALWLSSAARSARIVAAVAVLIAVFPIFSGNLSVPDGHGLQVFSQRSQFLDILGYLRSHRAPSPYRIAILPPWLAEQSLAPGEFYTANPFVFQSDIPVVDAKLVNTGNTTDNYAWQAYYGLYWGTDSHPAQTLANLGIRYVVVEDDASLSAGAAYSSFAGVPSGEVHYLLSRDPGFRAVYHSGPYWIYKDRLFRGLLRTADRPVVGGPIAPAVRQALPSNALGDDIDRTGTVALPRGVGSVGMNSLSVCVDRAPLDAITNAYTQVGKHNDYTGYWVASDWILRGPNTYSSRLLARFQAPYAFTRSRSSIRVPINSKGPGTLFAQLGTLAVRADVHIAVDGHPVPLVTASEKGFEWYRLGPAGPGHHVVSIRGDDTGLLVAKVAMIDAACAHPLALAGRRYFVPGPLVRASLHVGRTVTEVHMNHGSRPAKLVARFFTPEGASVAAIDNVPQQSGLPFVALRGINGLDFYGASGRPISGHWSFYDGAPFQENGGSVITRRRLILHGGRWPQLAILPVSGVKPGQMTMLHFSSAGGINGAKVHIRSSDSAINTAIDLAHLQSRYLLVPYLGSAYSVAISAPGNSVGGLVIERASVTSAVLLGTPHYFIIPSTATERSATRGRPGRGALLGRLRLHSDGSLVEESRRQASPFVPLHGNTHVCLKLQAFSASEATNVSVIAYYAMPFSLQQRRVVASVQVGPVPSNLSLNVPMLPNAVGILFSLVPDSAYSVLRDSNAAVSAVTGEAGGFRVVTPAENSAIGSALPYDRPSPEDMRVTRRVNGLLVGNFTYDPNWVIAGSRHWESDGYQNAWFVRGKNVSLRFPLQTEYSRLQLLAAIYLFLTFGAWAVEVLMARRRRGHDS